MLSLAKVLQEVLTELPRYKKQGIDLPTTYDEIDQVFDLAQKEASGLFVQYSDIPKLGINPQSKYNTPIGIYSYPAFQFSPENFKTGAVPFAYDRQYLVFFNLKPEYIKKMLVINYQGNAKTFQQEINEYIQSTQLDPQSVEDLKNALMQVKQIAISLGYQDYVNSPLEHLTDIDDIIPYVRPFIQLIDMINKVAKTSPNLDQLLALKQQIINIAYSDKGHQHQYILNARHGTDAGVFWNITREQSGRNPVKWAQILMSLGIYGVIDEGSGIIHPSEKTQAVIFSAEPIKLLKIINNPIAEKTKTNKLSNKQYDTLKSLLDDSHISFKYLLNFTNKVSNQEIDHLTAEIYDHFKALRSGLAKLQHSAVITYNMLTDAMMPLNEITTDLEWLADELYKSNLSEKDKDSVQKTVKWMTDWLNEMYDMLKSKDPSKPKTKNIPPPELSLANIKKNLPWIK